MGKNKIPYLLKINELNINFRVGNFIVILLNINDHTNISHGIGQLSLLISLAQNFPNPFSSSTSISYVLANESSVSIIARDITGRIVLEQNEGMKTAGKHTLILDASNLDPGIYFYTINAGNYKETKRMNVSR